MSDHQTAKNRLEGNEGQKFARENLVQVLHAFVALSHQDARDGHGQDQREQRENGQG